MRHVQRNAATCALLLQIRQRHRHAERRHLSRQVARQLAAIEAVEALVAQQAERLRQCRLGKAAALARRLAVRHKGGGKPRLMCKFVPFGGGGGRLRRGNWNAVGGIADGVAQQARQGQRGAAQLARERQRLLPAAYRPGYR